MIVNLQIGVLSWNDNKKSLTSEIAQMVEQVHCEKNFKRS